MLHVQRQVLKVLKPLRISRTLFSKSGTWDKEFNAQACAELEGFWGSRLRQHDKQAKETDSGREKYYVLSMFPYPSGALHMGHVRVYAISDTMARYHRLCGKDVIHPMGWDAFGLPAENAAIERGELPEKWTRSNITAMREQLDHLGLSFDWDRGFATCDPTYYRWTQYLFLKMYDAGLVYQKEAPVNWDPVDMTVLADEQIDENGKSWRSGAIVERKFLKQWYIKTTAYSKSLYDGLDEVDPDLWKDIIALQRNWIGKPDGTRIEFTVTDPSVGSLSVFTREVSSVFGISYILVSPDHILNNVKYFKDPSTDISQQYIPLSIQAQHPLTGDPIPVFVANNTDFGPYLDALIGIPSANAEHAEVAESLGLTYTQVMDENGNLVNSQEFSGMQKDRAIEHILQKLKACGHGGELTSERGRDWLISRQRYWGTPIPMIYCSKYGSQPIPYSDLPVELPTITEFSGKGVSPLMQADTWRKVKCANCDCDGYGQRVTDTMDTFVDSSWYFLRYLSPSNTNLPFDPKDAQHQMPVDLYIGGKEHAIMHLYYARFFMHFLYDSGVVPCREPFVNLLTQGMVMGRSYRLADTGRYLRPEEVVKQGDKIVGKETGETVIEDWEKMSKSKYNGVDPQTVIDEYGPEATRLCILSGVAPKSDRQWDHSAFQGVLRWQKRVWSLVTEFREAHTNSAAPLSEEEQKVAEEDVYEIRNLAVKDVSFHLSKTFLLSTAISRLHTMTSALRKIPPHTPSYPGALADLLIMVAPFAPMFASELWEGFESAAQAQAASSEHDWGKSIMDQRWPTVDSGYKLTMKVKKNGKRDQFELKLPMPLDKTGELTKRQALDLAMQHPLFPECFSGTSPPLASNVKLILVPKIRAELNIVEKSQKPKKNSIKQKQRSSS